MKRQTIQLLSILLGISGLAAGPVAASAATHSSASDVQSTQNTSGETRTTTTTTTTERQQYMQATQRHLDRLKRDISRLNSDAGAAADRSIQVAAAHLNVGLKVAEAKFANLRKAAGPAWQRARHSTDASLSALDRGVRNLDAKVRSANRQ